MKSSAFEGILLKATWPSDVVVAQEVLTDLIKYSIPAFKYTRSVRFLVVVIFLSVILLLIVLGIRGRSLLYDIAQIMDEND
jgi:hypothetical protein